MQPVSTSLSAKEGAVRFALRLRRQKREEKRQAASDVDNNGP